MTVDEGTRKIRATGAALLWIVIAVGVVSSSTAATASAQAGATAKSSTGLKLPSSPSGLVRLIKRKWDSAKDKDRESVRAAIERLKEISGDAKSREDVIKDFEAFKEEEASELIEDAIKDARVDVRALRKVLIDHRPGALKAILNPGYTKASGQELVDKACAPLFAVWNDPVGYAVESMELDIEVYAGQLDGLATLLGELDVALGQWPEPHANAEEYMRARGAEQLNVKEEEYKTNRRILERNEQTEGETLTEEEKLHVRVLNDYRMMLGKNALGINITLGTACKEHCKYMAKINKLAHDIDGHPYGRTMADRAMTAGYRGFVSAENILVGTTSGDEAVWQWYSSAGHHRNMVGNHTIIGIGSHEKYWTQNFAGGPQAARAK